MSSRTFRKTLGIGAVLVLTCVLLLSSSGISASSPKYTTRERYGVGVTNAFGAHIRDYDLSGLVIGWYSDWRTNPAPIYPAGVEVEYVQLIPVREGEYSPSADRIAHAVRASQGSLWLVGNEPENIHQGKNTPEQYAEVFFEVRNIIKGADPTARVAIGGVTQPTPLRLQWLDRVWSHYPTASGGSQLGDHVDVWNIHMQILTEEKGSWGAEIPAGIDATVGMTITLAENASVPLFQELVRDFREWMAAKGEQGKELIISEYGVLLPSDYLANGDRSVIDFMYGTFDYLNQAKDAAIGCPDDEFRLVQRWLWYSLNDKVNTVQSPTGFNGPLFESDVETYPYPGKLTVFGEAYRDYHRSYRLYLSVVRK